MIWPAALSLAIILLVAALDVSVLSTDSICAAAKIVADGEWNYYDGFQYGGTVGMFASPNYWWNAGEAFGGLIDYYTFCDPDNTTLRDWIVDGMYHQAGSEWNYIPSNQSMTEGNDDQGVWGMATIQAVERNLTNNEHSWLELTQAIYNTMNSRWDTGNCGGGLRWQIFTWNSGYNYKNAISNGCLFHIAARLARYTGLSNYTDTAEKVWNWMEEIEFFGNNSQGFYIHDGAEIEENCTDFTDLRWSYTYGVFLAGAAYMYDFTGDSVWLDRTQLVLSSLDYFFPDGVMTESQCMNTVQYQCNNDQSTFRSLFSRCLGLTASLVPDVKGQISDWMDKSAPLAAETCSGGLDGVTCGQSWADGTYDGHYSLGSQMNVLEALNALIAMNNEPLTADTGGVSESVPDAGTDSQDVVNKNVITVTTKDRAGAGVITAVILAVILGGAIWMLF